MNEPFDVSVIVSTYNRCEMLTTALESLLAQETNGTRYELIVVDNNSTDRTREAVESFIAQGHRHVRYIFEGRQGLSCGWNTGIRHARSPIIALTDDDMTVAPDYVAAVKRAFDEHPEADYVCGKVLPHWKREPPAWLEGTHWGPLAIQDHGDEPFYTNEARRLCLINKSFRRDVFERVGYFKPELGRIKDQLGSSEDHELQSRIWQSGGQGLYIPSIVSFAEVQEERMTKEYHRRWHTGHGYYFALMRLKDIDIGDVRLFDVPAHLYRQALKDLFGWCKQTLRRNEELAFGHANELRFFYGFFRQRRQDFKKSSTRGTVREIALFAQTLVASKLHRRKVEENPLSACDKD
jgi:glycosyltransferase involved in cell wall biosynthesis